MSSNGRLVLATFCDDIRYEQGNKYSLIGCYREDLLISHIPAVLPKLCAAITVITPIDRLFEKLTICARVGDETIAELEIRDEQLQALKNETLKQELSDMKKVELHCHMTFSPFNVLQPSSLRIDAETEDGVIKGSILNILLKTETNPVGS